MVATYAKDKYFCYVTIDVSVENNKNTNRAGFFNELNQTNLPSGYSYARCLGDFLAPKNCYYFNNT